MDDSEESRRRRLLESYERSGVYLFQATCERLVSLAKAKGLDPESARDVTQEAFATLFEKRPKLTNVEGWLVCVVRRRSIDLLRRRRTERGVLNGLATREQREPEDPLLRGRLEAAVRRLSPGARSLLRHRYVAGRSEMESALAAGYAPSSFKQTLTRALARLRRLLTGSTSP